MRRSPLLHRLRLSTPIFIPLTGCHDAAIYFRFSLIRQFHYAARFSSSMPFRWLADDFATASSLPPPDFRCSLPPRHIPPPFASPLIFAADVSVFTGFSCAAAAAVYVAVAALLPPPLVEPDAAQR
jgi:hypothetical protein